MFRRVLVPVDFGACSVQAVTHAFDLVRVIGGSLTLLHVLEEPQAPDGPAEARLRQLAERGRRPPTLLVAAPGEHSVAEAILAAARRVEAELLVLGPHGGPDPTVHKLGRVATEVLLGAHLPVQLVPGAFQPAPEPGARWRALAKGEHDA
ncbi:universal stress protein [Deinococcus planocerae]|uniref:universal stress protein n=1 Tax=Deinococcus planocerae TaxID=1737569 RepID=UPI0015E11F63|nr:universal stress protein [Deinococcus planocerae]